MTGLVEQLQSDALDPEVSTDTLLRKVKVAAAKLGLDDALKWVGYELTGYGDFADIEDIPDYRKGQGQTLAWNSYHGWQPVEFGDGKMADLVSSVLLLEPIGSYEKLIKEQKGKLHLPVPNALAVELNKLANYPTPRFVNSLSPGMIVRVVDRVRDMVLDWSLELSRVGITGDGLSFSANEREKAADASINIGVFHGSFNTGDAVGENSKVSVSTQIDQSGQLFSKIEQAILTQIPEAEQREAILDANRKMSEASEKSALLQAYNGFVGAAANHMTVLTPFLPALAALIASM